MATCGDYTIDTAAEDVPDVQQLSEIRWALMVSSSTCWLASLSFHIRDRVYEQFSSFKL
jgi:hypothetical protein